MQSVSTSNRELEAPKIISMTMTSRCNLRCVMCDHGIRNVKKEDFKADLVDKAGDFISSASLVDLTGLGEPMLSDLFWRILAKFPVSAEPTDKEFFLTFNSNGTLLNTRNIERILLSRVRKIRISIDSPDPELFGRIRGTDLAPIVAGLRNLIAQRNALGRKFPRIGVEMTLMRANLDGLHPMVELCADLGADFLEVWSLNQVSEESRKNWQVQKNDWTFDYTEQMVDNLHDGILSAAIDSLYDEAAKRGLSISTLILGNWRATGELFADNHQFFGEKQPTGRWQEKSIKCNLPWKELRITYDGDVFACCWGPAPIGNLRTQTLEDIWKCVAIEDMRTDLINGVIPRLCSGAACPEIKGRRRPLIDWKYDPSVGEFLELSSVPATFEPDSGLYGLETYQGRPLRWTNGAAEFSVEPQIDGPFSLFVKLWNIQKENVTISVNGIKVYAARVPAGGLETMISIGSGTSFVIRLESNTFQTSATARRLGVAIENLRLVKSKQVG
jgi:MoaA/NifB/PqqE/SkfB family radical SAM enzyme